MVLSQQLCILLSMQAAWCLTHFLVFSLMMDGNGLHWLQDQSTLRFLPKPINSQDIPFTYTLSQEMLVAQEKFRGKYGSFL